VSDRCQLQCSIAYVEAVMVQASDRLSAHYLCHATLAITPLGSTGEEVDCAAPADVHASQRYPDPTTDLLVCCSPNTYNGSTRALRSADLHPLFQGRQEEGGWCLRCAGQQREIE
jgi:hypothetical protein